MPSLLQSLIVTPTVLWVPRPQSWEVGRGSRMKPPLPRVSDLLHAPLGHTQLCGAGWDPPKGTEGSAGSAHWATFHQLLTVQANWGGPNQPEVVKCHTHL